MSIPLSEGLSTALMAFGLIFLAEMGDKSQLVCMALAARYRTLPVLSGAILAFALLNLLAVLFGAAIAAWVPKALVAGMVAVLFGTFGIRALWSAGQAVAGMPEKSEHGMLWSTFMLIFIAEFGDKTQLAVAGLAGTHAAPSVWLGSTAALAVTSTLGVVAGRTLLQRIPMHWLHRLGGLLFLVMAGLAAWRALGMLG